MRVTGNTVLITGGGSGIGFALAQRFAARENTVIICGRRGDKLEEAKQSISGLHTVVCDVASPGEREDLVNRVMSDFPEINVLVNNAGIQRRIDLTSNEDWDRTGSEIAVNLEAPIHLSQLFFPHLASKENSAIVNVTSGLSFVPLANVPVYCATKAALHSFTASLRWQLKDTPVEVIEIIPPAVDTDLQAPGLHTFGVDVDEFADHVFKELEKGKIEIAYGTALAGSRASRDQLDETFERMNSTFR
ncbi:MAG: SDR family NAD(P)-dependent oxidoreductase [Acidobacteria bacterium]|nr:SDR family NAD(P)-dependent oxidoreductase [Acidobacteriota bacterium]